ncbi:MAG: SMEK domain-containing protein [Acidobacteriota bacterium]|nr:SMEK domain-containing protein [Acidobacteriota bacterium]
MKAREHYIKNIIEILTNLKTRIEQNASLSLYDSHKHAENFYRDLLNLVYGLKLENLNSEIKNAAFIDLIDRECKIAIQVTSQNDSEKIKKSIIGLYENIENLDYELKMVLISKLAKDYTADFSFGGKHKFDHQKDVIDIGRLLAVINDKKTDEIETISNFLSKEFYISNPDSNREDLIEKPLRGLLISANEPNPSIKFGVIKPDYKAIYMGNSVASISPDIQKFDLIRIADESIVEIKNVGSGLIINATIYDELGNIVATVRENIFRCNRLKTYEATNPDQHSILILDDSDKIVLYIRYLNPRALKVLGVFCHPERPAVTIKEDGIMLGNNRIGIMFTEVSGKDTHWWQSKAAFVVD